MQVIEEQTKTVIDHSDRADQLADFIMFTQRSFLLDLSNELNNGNVSYAQFFLLGYLAEEEYLTMTDISKKMGHSTAAATGLVDRLEKLGYVQRLHAADDRRKVMVQISRKGIELVKRLRDVIAKNVTSAMADGSDSAGEREAVPTQLREFMVGA
ncbi:MAG: MarR family transcriptional regulator [Verrucomicrobiales bacterium]|nr:MarR family transcriptional regulator [Verrucomicrobiales bacterium]